MNDYSKILELVLNTMEGIDKTKINPLIDEYENYWIVIPFNNPKNTAAYIAKVIKKDFKVIPVYPWEVGEDCRYIKNIVGDNESKPRKRWYEDSKTGKLMYYTA